MSLLQDEFETFFQIGLSPVECKIIVLNQCFVPLCVPYSKMI